MDLTNFLKSNNIFYNIFLFDNSDDSWKDFSAELASFLGIDFHHSLLSEDYFVYGGLFILNEKNNKLIFVPNSWNKNAKDYLLEKTKIVSNLKEFKDE